MTLNYEINWIAHPETDFQIVITHEDEQPKAVRPRISKGDSSLQGVKQRKMMDHNSK